MQTIHKSLVLLGAIACATGGLAHTNLETVNVTEGVRVVNNVQIGHACGNGTSAIGTSVVFPDGKDSTLLVNNQAYTGKLTDFITASMSTTLAVCGRSSLIQRPDLPCWANLNWLGATGKRA